MWLRFVLAVLFVEICALLASVVAPHDREHHCDEEAGVCRLGD